MRVQRPTLPDSETTMLVRCPPTVRVTVTGKLVEGVDSTTKVRCAGSYLIQLGSGLLLVNVTLALALALPGWRVTDSGRVNTKALPPRSTVWGTTTLTKPAAAALGRATTDTLTLAVLAGVLWAVVAALAAGRAVVVSVVVAVVVAVAVAEAVAVEVAVAEAVVVAVVAAVVAVVVVAVEPVDLVFYME